MTYTTDLPGGFNVAIDEFARSQSCGDEDRNHEIMLAIQAAYKAYEVEAMSRRRSGKRRASASA